MELVKLNIASVVMVDAAVCLCKWVGGWVGVSGADPVVLLLTEQGPTARALLLLLFVLQKLVSACPGQLTPLTTCRCCARMRRLTCTQWCAAVVADGDLC